MTNPEIMRCAAILASGIIASEKREPCVSADEAVGLMEQIAAVIEDHKKAEQVDNANKWIK